MCCGRLGVAAEPTAGHRALEARIVNDADDFVICCRGSAEAASAAMRNIMSHITLTVNDGGRSSS